MNVITVKNYLFLIIGASLGITSSIVSTVLHAISCMSLSLTNTALGQIKQKEENSMTAQDLALMPPHQHLEFVCDIFLPSSSSESILEDTLDSDDVEFTEGEESHIDGSEELLDREDEGKNSNVHDKAVPNEELGVANAKQPLPEKVKDGGKKKAQG